MAMVGCSNEDIALLCDCSADTIERNYAVAVKIGRARRNHSLYKVMFETAKHGSAAVQIFLAKNWLGMRDMPLLETGEAVLTEVLAEYRKRYELLAAERGNGDARNVVAAAAQPADPAQKPKRSHHKRQAQTGGA
jgi:hypothetical protein